MLKLKNVGKVFNQGTPNEKVALKKVDLTLGKGEFITVIGGNGAGKSTLLNLIAGTYFPDSGSISLDEENITFVKEYKRARNIGHLFQDPLKGTAPSLTIEENLSLAYGHGHGHIFKIGIPKKEKDLFRDHLETLGMGLENRMQTKMGLLSGGQRQAVTLIMATISKPKLLLLDEHTSALDPAAAEKISKLTESIIKKDNITTLMITHNIESALSYGNRTVMLNEGSVILDLSGEQRKNMTTIKLLELFKKKMGENFSNDKAIL